MLEKTVQVPTNVTQVITDEGYWYQVGDNKIGPFTVQDERDPHFDEAIAQKLQVEVKDIIAARLQQIEHPTTFREVAEVLSSTIRHDQPTKLILFCACLLTFTEEDQRFLEL